MNRRTVLAGSGSCLAMAIAGCFAFGTDREDAGEGDGGEPTLEIVGVETDSPPDLPIEPAVSVITRQSTETSPAGIAVEWENVGDGPVRVGEADAMVFAAARSVDDRAHLLAFDRIGDRRDSVSFGDCWYVSDPLTFDGEYATVHLDPGDRHTAEPDLYARDETCLAPGTYRFETSVRSAARHDRPEKTVELGFALELERA